MANEDLLLTSHHIGTREDAWWYEIPRGVEILVECRTPGDERLEIKTIVLPWKALRAALARKDQ